MAETKKKRPPKFKVPRKGEKCSKVVKPKSAFHKGSFRWVSVGDRSSSLVMVGCPLATRSKTMARDAKKSTRWDPRSPVGRQCTFSGSGEKAGLTAHMVVQPRHSGSCRVGYTRD